MKKKVLATLIAILAMGNTVFASEQINVDKNQVNIVVNGKTVESDNFLYKGTTYVPLRTVSDNLNGSVNYDNATKTANISSNASTANSSNNNSNVFLMWKSSCIMENATGLFYVFCLSNPDMVKNYTEDDFTDTMETFDTYVSTAVEIYNSVYDLEITELYPAVEELQELAVTLNEYGHDLVDMKFKGSTSIDSKYNEKLDIITTKYLNIIDSIDKYQTKLLDENTK
jgi:hypothetical protein